MPENGTLTHTIGANRLEGLTRYNRAGRGTAVLLLHGLGMQHTIWRPQAEALKTFYDVITFDMLGHGGSSLPPETPALSDYADQLLSVMDALDIASAHIAGHSMGALISLEFALAHPDRVRSVAPLNGVYCRSEMLRQAVEQRARLLEESNGITAPDETLIRWFGDPIPPELREVAQTARALLLSVNPTGYRRTYRLFANSDRHHHGRLQRLAVPALFMTSEHDAHSTPEMSRAMAADAPNSRCVVLPNERHMMTITAPDAVTQELARFFHEVDADQPVTRGTAEVVK